jgi:hypothetical protein
MLTDDLAKKGDETIGVAQYQIPNPGAMKAP